MSMSLFLDEALTFLVIRQPPGRVVKISPDGSSRDLSSSMTPLSSPSGLAIDANNVLYVSDSAENDIVVFDTISSCG